MGIDYATWRARIGLNNCRQCRFYHPLPVQWRAAKWGVGEVINDTPLVLQGCIVVVSLLLILEYKLCSWRICPKGRSRFGKVRCPKLGGGSVLSAEARGMVGVASGVHIMLKLCVVVLALLLIAGDIERNPGPPKKEGSPTAELLRRYFSKLAAAILYPERLANELYSKNVVSTGVRDEMGVIGQSSYHKTTKLLTAVECQTKVNPGSLHTFLSVLREDPSLVYIADAMSDEYRLLSPPKSADTCLPTLSQLSAELRDFKRWYLLGLQLNIRKDILDSIEHSHDTKDRQCVEMIQHWINNSKTPTWGAVHEALRNIGESVLAEKYAVKYDIQPSSSSEDDSKSDQSTSCTSEELSLMSTSSVSRVGSTSVGSVDEERSLVPTSSIRSSSSIKGKSTAVVKPKKHLQIISREQWRVSAYFAIVMRRITKILAQHVDLEDLVSFLQFQCHPLNPEALYVDKHILQHISSVSEVIKSLVPDYINYMETGLLEAIVESFEVEEAQDLLQEYHDRYPHLRQLSNMPDPVPDERLDLTRRKRLRAKCDGDFESARANDIKRIRMSIESATGIDHRFVTPAQHSEGSLILTFLIPESVSGIFQELCDEDLEILALSGIVELHIDNVIISNIQTTGSSTQSASVPSADQRGAIVKGFDSYIERREEQFTSKEKTQLTDLLNNVPKSRLEELCTDSFLQQLAPHMTDWRKLAPSFGISKHGAEKLAHCYPDIDEQRYRALQEWKRTTPETATYGNLVACLLAHAPFHLAEAALMTLTPDTTVQEARKLLKEAYLLQESQPLWPGAPAILQFDRRLGRVTKDTPKLNNETLKDIDYSSQFETLEQFSSEVDTLSIKCFLNSVTEKKEHFFHMKGPPGSGKTALLQRVCAFWAQGFCLRKFTFVLWLSLNTYPSEPLISSPKSFLNYCLPQGSHIDSIEQWVCRHEGEGVLVVIDGIDNQHLHFVDNVLTEKRLKKATTILAVSCTLNYPSSRRYKYMYQTQYHLLGLSREQILKQVIQHYHHNTSRAEEFLVYISETHTIRALCSSPPYLATVLFVFDNVNTSDLPNTWTQLFTKLLKLLGLSSDTPNTQSRLITRLLRRSTVSDHDTLAILTSKAYAVTSNNSSFNWQDCFTNFCNRITSPYRTMVTPADHCCFTLMLLQHYLCAQHIRTLPRKQHRPTLSEVPLHVRQFYVGLRNSVKRVKLLLKYPATLMSVACLSEIPLERLQYLMSSQLTFNCRWLTTIDIQSILQAVYHSGLPCNLQFHSCCFGVQAVKMILKGLPILPSGGTVQKLSLSQNSISDSGACELAETLKVNQFLQKLDLSRNNISDSGACVLAETLKVNQCLQKLDLSQNSISDSGTRRLAEALKVNQALLKLVLSHNTISDKGAYVLATALQANRSLQELHVYQNKISDNGLRVLTGALQLDQRLQRLILEKNKTSVKGASALGSLELQLSWNKISDDGARALSGVLEVNQSLHKLDLSGNNISDDGVHELSEALKVNQSLQELYLSYNKFSDGGARALSGALEVNQSLHKINLSNNKISDDGVHALSGALKVNQSLHKINLSFNEISDDGVHALSEALKVNQSLQELDLSWNLISSGGESALLKAKHKNKNLKINLDYQWR